VESRLSDVTFRLRATLRAKAKVVDANRLWAYHDSRNFSWDASDVPCAEDDTLSVDNYLNPAISGEL